MLRQAALALAVVGALMLPSEAFAGHGGGHGGKHHGGGHHGGGHHGSGKHHGHGHNGRWHNGHWYAGHGRYWHGRWYDYGVGACWSFTPAGWIWVCY